MAETSPESPLTELATAVGFDEDDCGLDILYAVTGGITGNAEGKSPVESPRAPFSLKFKDEVSPYSLMSSFVPARRAGRGRGRLHGSADPARSLGRGG